MNELKDELDKLAGRSKPRTYQVSILITEFDNPRLVHTNEIDWLIDMCGSDYLTDILGPVNSENLPTEIGLHSADLIANSFMCNHPEDPEEWDMTIKLENIKKI